MSIITAQARAYADPINPGQFFACCGLLELADRLFGGAEGWFDGGAFNIALKNKGNIKNILEALVNASVEEIAFLENGVSIPSLIAPLRLTLGEEAKHVLFLDAWLSIGIERGKIVVKGNRPWNFWSGQQTSVKIWKSLSAELKKQIVAFSDTHYECLFKQRIPTKGRFGFDPRSAWKALDVGFSPDKQEIKVSSSPATELLAAVGIQRFSTKLSRDRMFFEYCTWGQPLSPSVASAAASGAIVVPPTVKFRGQVIDRGNYAGLGYSSIIKGERNGRFSKRQR